MQSLFRFTGEAGNHAVGVQVLEMYDTSRHLKTEPQKSGSPRALQIVSWYPAEARDAAPMTVGSYLDLWETETSFGRPHVSARAQEWRAGMAATLVTPLRGVRDAPPASGPFPVVIYAPGLPNPSWENADLCEYLASHGYLVLASACMGATEREGAADVTTAKAQALDVSFLISIAHDLPNADNTQIAVIGFSWGGISNVIAAARDERIKALICWDGSIRFSPGIVWEAGVDPGQLRIPLLSMVQGLWTPEDQDRTFESFPGHAGPNVLNTWGGDLFIALMPALSHMEFSAMYQRNERMWWNLFNIYHQKKADYTREHGIGGYAWCARYTRKFVDAYLKNDTEAMTFLRRPPPENGVPLHFMAISFRPGRRDSA